MRNQSIVASKLPELSEATEQEKGNGYYLLFFFLKDQRCKTVKKVKVKSAA